MYCLVCCYPGIAAITDNSHYSRLYHCSHCLNAKGLQRVEKLMYDYIESAISLWLSIRIVCYKRIDITTGMIATPHLFHSVR